MKHYENVQKHKKEVKEKENYVSAINAFLSEIEDIYIIAEISFQIVDFVSMTNIIDDIEDFQNLGQQVHG